MKVIAVTYLSSVKPSEEYCKSVIASNNPILLHIFGTDLNHAVVGYGYEADGIHVNYGWKNSKFNTCISKYTIERALYINIDSKHNCSNNYHWTVNGITGTICPCGKKVCNHGSKKLYKYDDTYHKLGCLVCGGDYTLINHSYVTDGEYKTCRTVGIEFIQTIDLYIPRYSAENIIGRDVVAVMKIENRVWGLPQCLTRL